MSSIDRHRLLLVSMNVLQIFLWTCFHFLGKYLGRELLGHRADVCCFRGSCQIFFYSDYSVLHFHPHCLRVPFSLRPYQCFMLCMYLFNFIHSGGCILWLLINRYIFKNSKVNFNAMNYCYTYIFCCSGCCFN